MKKSTLMQKFERKTVRLEGLSEKIFLDRYARKDLKPERLEPGDTVLVLTKDDPRFPQKEVGEVVAVEGGKVHVRLRSGQDIVVDKEKLVKPLETTPDQMWDRIAKAIAAAEAPEKRAEWEEKFRYLLDDWKMVPGGRILAGAGVTEELTLFNCYVLHSPKDSRGGIMETLTQMTEIMSRGGGVGINLSSLRPRRALVRGVNGSSSGAVSWGGLFSYTTGLIEQGGSRRGALMLMLNDWHPDLLEFITVKTQMGLLTNANLSVCISDAFMKAVKEDKEWHLVFPDTTDPDYDELWDGNLEKWKALGKPIQVYKTVRARDVWHTIIESAWRSAEPGVVFIDYYNKMSNSWYYNPIICTNPCFHPDTRIATEFGLIRIEDLFKKVGNQSFLVATDDRLVNQVQVVNGRPYEVPGVTLRQAVVFPTGVRETLVVTLKNGMELKVTPEHRIYTDKGWKEARYLTPDDWVYIQSGEGRFAETDDLGCEWGWFLGWLTGDGWISKRGDIGMVFGKEDAEVIPKMVEIGKALSGAEAKVYRRKNGTYQVYWWRKEFLERLLELGVKPVRAVQKEVPDAIFTASRETVVAFLQGLFSADGTVYENDIMHRTVRLTSASKKLLQGVQLLLLNFGIHGVIYPRRKANQQPFTYRTVDGEERVYASGEFYELILSGDNLNRFKETIGFELVTRKQQALERIARPSRKMEKFMSRVESVTRGETVTVYDVMEPVTHSLIANGFVVHNCGEQGLPAWGVCNLGHINLAKFVKDGEVDWETLGECVRYAVRFLDNVIDITPYHFKENEENQKGERRIGLGTMGLAEMLIRLKIRYGSEECLAFLDKLYHFIAREAYLASTEIAAEKGPFPKFDAEKFLQSRFVQQFEDDVKEAIRTRGIRNVTLLTQAPTGSTGTMVGTSTGIEPFYAFEYYRQSRLGFDKQYVPIAKEWMDQHPGEPLPDYFVTAMDLTAEDHIRVQAAIQKWVDSSISKTANAPADFTIEETKKLYELAYDLGCKGVTIYRDGSRDAQVLHTTKKKDDEAKGKEAAAGAQAGASGGVKAYRRRPKVLRGATYKMNTPLGKAYITINDLDGKPFEVIVNVGKAGSDVFAMSEALGRVATLFLRFGELPDGNKARLLIKHLKGIGGSGAVGFGKSRVESIPDAVAKALELHLSGAAEEAAEESSSAGEEAAGYAGYAPARDEDGDIAVEADLCPECGAAALIAEEGCKRCVACGYAKCN